MENKKHECTALKWHILTSDFSVSVFRFSSDFQGVLYHKIQKIIFLDVRTLWLSHPIILESQIFLKLQDIGHKITYTVLSNIILDKSDYSENHWLNVSFSTVCSVQQKNCNDWMFFDYCFTECSWFVWK